MVVKHEPNPDAKVESDPDKETQEVESRMDDDSSPLLVPCPMQPATLDLKKRTNSVCVCLYPKHAIEPVMERSQIHFYVNHIGSNPPLQGFGDIGKREHAFKIWRVELQVQEYGSS